MIKTLWIKITNAWDYLVYRAIRFLIFKNAPHTHRDTLLVIRMDAIGDFVLFRDFLSAIRKSDKYGHFDITLCGNPVWKDLAVHFNQDDVNHFLWIDRGKFHSSAAYKYKMLKDIYQRGYQVVLNTSYSREILFDDAIAIASRAPLKIASQGSFESHARWKRPIFSDRDYQQIIPASSANLFEFERNRQFIEQALDEKVEITAPHIDTSGVVPRVSLPGAFIVVFPGAGDPKRCWHIDHFAEIIRYIIKEFSLHIVLAGALNEAATATRLMQQLPADRAINLTGRTTLSELAKLISDSLLLISNETGAVHISAAVGTPFICISNGNHLGRFHPYPKSVFPEASYIYPPEIKTLAKNGADLTEMYRFGSELDINTIAVETVEAAISSNLEGRKPNTGN